MQNRKVPDTLSSTYQGLFVSLQVYQWGNTLYVKKRVVYIQRSTASFRHFTETAFLSMSINSESALCNSSVCPVFVPDTLGMSSDSDRDTEG